MGMIKVVSPAQAGRIIDARLSRIERNGFRGRAALARLIRPSDIAAGFSSSGPVEVSAVVASRVSDIKLPEMINISESVSIMKGEVTVGLFKQVMEGYEITVHNAEELKAILADPSQVRNALTYVSLNDAREFARRLSVHTGRKFRVQTEEEWLAARDGLSGNNYTLTETRRRRNEFVHRCLNTDIELSDYAERRLGDRAIRLVEDK